MKAKEVTIYKNGNIMAFDEKGEQMTNCQGCFLDVRIVKSLNKYCDKDTQFYFGDWIHKMKDPVNVKWWFEQEEIK